MLCNRWGLKAFDVRLSTASESHLQEITKACCFHHEGSGRRLRHFGMDSAVLCHRRRWPNTKFWNFSLNVTSWTQENGSCVNEFRKENSNCFLVVFLPEIMGSWGGPDVCLITTGKYELAFQSLHLVGRYAHVFAWVCATLKRFNWKVDLAACRLVKQTEIFLFSFSFVRVELRLWTWAVSLWESDWDLCFCGAGLWWRLWLHGLPGWEWYLLWRRLLNSIHVVIVFFFWTGHVINSLPFAKLVSCVSLHCRCCFQLQPHDWYWDSSHPCQRSCVHRNSIPHSEEQLFFLSNAPQTVNIVKLQHFQNSGGSFPWSLTSPDFNSERGWISNFRKWIIWRSSITRGASSFIKWDFKNWCRNVCWPWVTESSPSW